MNPEPKNPEKKEKKLNKFTWQGTEESILKLFHLLIKAGFIHSDNYYSLQAIIRDTFKKINEDTKEITDFDNNQLNAVKGKKKDKRNENFDFSKIPLSKQSKDKIKFQKLIDYLQKIIPEDKIS